MKNAHLDKHLSFTFSNDSSSSKSKKSWKKSTKLSDSPILMDGHVAGFDINVWESKMVKNLTTNANYYPTEALHMVYVDNYINEKAYKNLAARSRIGTQKPFATIKEMFKVLQKAYGNVN